MKQTKAFLFDMDGVLINSEAVWVKYDTDFTKGLFGEAIFEKVKDHLLGGSTNLFYDIAVQHGFTMPKDEYNRRYDTMAEKIYQAAQVTEGIEDIIRLLQKKNFKIGLVTSSRNFWIDCALKKMSFRDAFEYKVSVNDREDLRGKPKPDGYLDAMSHFGSKPETTIILEDSNTGIKAAKASGALTICLRHHLEEDYLSEGADIVIENVRDLKRFIELL